MLQRLSSLPNAEDVIEKRQVVIADMNMRVYRVPTFTLDNC